jgi:hypothetical protein
MPLPYRSLSLFLGLSLLLVARRLHAQDLPVIGQSAVSTPDGSHADSDDAPGLLMLRLPLESRTSVIDYLGRNFPGAMLTSDGRLRLHGGQPEDTALEIDGLRFRRLTLPVAMIERLDVASAGYGPEQADVLGGVVGVTTRSGSNRWHASLDASNEFHELTDRVISPAVSGPIVRDRLFFAFASRLELASAPGVSDPFGIVTTAAGPDARDLGGALKLTFIPRVGQRLEGLVLLDDTRVDHGAPLGYEPEADPAYNQRAFAASVRWLGTLGKTVTAHAQMGFQSDRFEEMPLRCRSEGEVCDTVPSVVQRYPARFISGNWPRHRIDIAMDWEGAAGVEARVFESPRVRERVRATSRARLGDFGSRLRTTGDQITVFNGGPEHQEVTYANDPRREAPRFGWFSTGGSALTTVNTLESETRLFSRLWVVPGLGLVTSLARTDNFTIATAALLPQLGVAWDAFGGGQTWLHASSRQRTATDAETLVEFGRASPATQSCLWSPDTQRYDKSCVLSGGPFTGSVGLPCGPDGLNSEGAPCRQPPRLPRAWEHTVGIEQALGRGFRLDLDVLYRRAGQLSAMEETNRIWNPSGENVLGYRNGRAQQIMDYSAVPTASLRYLDATVAVKKAAGAFRLLAAYTYSPDGGTSQLQSSAPGRYFFSTGAERPHSLRAMLSYDLNDAALGLIYTLDSGAPLTRLFRNSVNSDNPNVRAPVGTNPGSNLNDPADDRPTRLPVVKRTNLQGRLRGRRLIGLDLDLYVDIINLFDRRQFAIDPATLSVIGPGEKRWTRLGLEYHY